MQTPIQTNDTAMVRDRLLPVWARILSTIFATSSGLAWLAMSMVGLMLFDTAIRDHDTNTVFLAGAIGVISICAASILEFAHARALIGLDRPRQQFSEIVQAVLAGVVAVLLLIVHPLLCVGILLSTLVLIAGTQMVRRLEIFHDQAGVPYQEAVALLAGRDRIELEQNATAEAVPSVVTTVRRAAVAVAVLGALTCGSWLVINHVITLGALVAAVLMSLWSARALGAFAHQWLERGKGELLPRHDRSKSGPTTPHEDDIEEPPPNGLFVAALCAQDRMTETPVFGPVSFAIGPGKILGLTGDGASGKSLLLNCLIGDAGSGLDLTGRALLNGQTLARRSGSPSQLAALILRQLPLMLSGGAVANINCFDPDKSADDARRALHRLDVFGDAAERICSYGDARLLSDSDAQLVSLARAFATAPQLYLFDMPETNLSQPALNALIEQIRIERAAGKIFVIASRSRPILQICDELVVIDNGRLSDRGSADDILRRQSSGWTRLVVGRETEEEDRLHNWVKAQFNRRGDDQNRRNACLLAAEMLALSCADDSRRRGDDVIFDFRHFKGECRLSMQDNGPPVTSARLQSVKSDPASRSDSPLHRVLANVLRQSTDFLQEMSDDGDRPSRKIMCVMKTYDPRLNQAPAPQPNE